MTPRTRIKDGADTSCFGKGGGSINQLTVTSTTLHSVLLAGRAINEKMAGDWRRSLGFTDRLTAIQSL